MSASSLAIGDPGLKPQICTCFSLSGKAQTTSGQNVGTDGADGVFCVLAERVC